MFAEFQRLALGAELCRDLGELPAVFHERQRGLDHGPGLRLGCIACRRDFSVNRCGGGFYKQLLQRALLGDVVIAPVVFIIGPEAFRIGRDIGGDLIDIQFNIGDPDLFRLKVITGIGLVIFAYLALTDLDGVHKPAALKNRIADVAGLRAESPDARRFLIQHKQAFREAGLQLLGQQIHAHLIFKIGGFHAEAEYAAFIFAAIKALLILE